MSVRRDCRHYSTRSVGADVIQRCRVAANVDAPFACPDGCIFFETRSITDAGWRRFDDSDIGDEGGTTRD